MSPLFSQAFVEKHFGSRRMLGRAMINAGDEGDYQNLSGEYTLFYLVQLPANGGRKRKRKEDEEDAGSRFHTAIWINAGYLTLSGSEWTAEWEDPEDLPKDVRPVSFAEQNAFVATALFITGVEQFSVPDIGIIALIDVPDLIKTRKDLVRRLTAALRDMNGVGLDQQLQINLTSTEDPIATPSFVPVPANLPVAGKALFRNLTEGTFDIYWLKRDRKLRWVLEGDISDYWAYAHGYLALHQVASSSYKSPGTPDLRISYFPELVSEAQMLQFAKDLEAKIKSGFRHTEKSEEEPAVLNDEPGPSSRAYAKPVNSSKKSLPSNAIGSSSRITTKAKPTPKSKKTPKPVPMVAAPARGRVTKEKQMRSVPVLPQQSFYAVPQPEASESSESDVDRSSDGKSRDRIDQQKRGESKRTKIQDVGESRRRTVKGNGQLHQAMRVGAEDQSSSAGGKESEDVDDTGEKGGKRGEKDDGVGDGDGEGEGHNADGEVADEAVGDEDEVDENGHSGEGEDEDREDGDKDEDSLNDEDDEDDDAGSDNSFDFFHPDNADSDRDDGLGGPGPIRADSF